jgi:hypothetical protein
VANCATPQEREEGGGGVTPTGGARMGGGGGHRALLDLLAVMRRVKGHGQVEEE